MGAVLEHLLGPGQLGILEDRLQDEERTVEPQRFPSLREGPARFARLDDHRGMAEERHGAVAPRKVRAQGRMTRRKLSYDEVFLHQPALEWGVRSRMRLIQRRPENRDRATAALQRLFVCRGIDSRG